MQVFGYFGHGKINSPVGMARARYEFGDFTDRTGD